MYIWWISGDLFILAFSPRSQFSQALGNFFLTASSNTLRGLRGKHHIGTSLHAGKKNMDGEDEPALIRGSNQWIEGTEREKTQLVLCVV